MEDPCDDLRQAIARLDFYWDRAPSPERTIKLAAVAAKLKSIQGIIQDEIDRWTNLSRDS